MDIKRYTSLAYIPIFNYYKCLEGDFYFMEVGEKNQNEIQAKSDAKKYSEDDVLRLKIEFDAMLKNHDGSRNEKAVALWRKQSIIKKMQSINLEVREVVMAGFTIGHLMDEEDKIEYQKIRKHTEKKARNMLLKMNVETNERIIQKKIDDLETIVEGDSEQREQSIEDMYQSITALHSLLGVSIDEMSTSALKFFQFQKMAEDKVKQMHNQKAKNGRL